MIHEFNVLTSPKTPNLVLWCADSSYILTHPSGDGMDGFFQGQTVMTVDSLLALMMEFALSTVMEKAVRTLAVSRGESVRAL